jgi:hypothetical protein
VLGAAAVVLVLLGPAIFLSSREPFNRLMEFLDLLLGGAEVTRRQLLAASDDGIRLNHGRVFHALIAAHPAAGLRWRPAS